MKKILKKKKKKPSEKSSGENLDKRQAENEILKESQRATEKNYQEIFNSVNDALFIHDIKTGAILDVNKKMCEMYGYTKKEALEGDVGMISSGLPPYDQKQAEKKVKLAASGIPQVFEWHSKTKKGRLFWVEVSLSKVTLDAEDRIIAVVRDISERKAVEQEMIHINKSKTEFLTIAAHQLRTPLSSMRWNNEMLLRKAEEMSLPQEVTELINKNYQSNLQVIDLVNNLLNVSKIDQKRLKYSPSAVDLVELIEEIIDIYKHQTELKSLQVRFRVAKNHRYIVSLDREQMKQALSNIIGNAIKYSYQKTTVNISINRKEKYFEIKTSNEGIGIPAFDNDHIFEKFYRAKDAIKQGPDGTGLGLFIAKSFIEKVDGNISFSSDGSHRTIFVVRIPTKKT